MRKLTLLVGIGIGYVLGARAGRARYDQIKTQAQNAWNNPTVQEKAAEAQAKVRETAPKVGEAVTEKAGEVAQKASEVASDVAAKVRRHDDDTDPGTPIADGLAQPGSSFGR